ncbi:methionine--tRNA ligase [Candidatus Haliotispira prima]|uniref:Methionine--tRNA ligase n=1 Tax=Candidatus Haliotispira prima TaxID=3034016 RepID=A0ABY8MLH3_9SPIO|nr:methionine--tRNA ligase [Candidatus Haliotispira prima]
MREHRKRKNMKKRLITSALPYVNNIPHLGNLIQVLSADVFARFCRRRGYETLYVCGSDEYGTATETRALKEKTSPKELCDRFHQVHKEIYTWFNIEFDHFGRTSGPWQTKIVQQIYREVEAAGYILKREMEQTYCDHCKCFLADRYICGNCPHCGSTNAHGDQCEDCGTMLDPTDLLEPRCGICGREPQRRKTEHLFIDLPALKDRLEAWIDVAGERGRWAKNALQMTRSWIRDGLKQRCITRDLSWGVPVPDMPGKVFYVWFDAPIGYISITAELLEQSDPQKGDWRSWWQNPDEVELFQFIGKDNIPFHTVLFPSSLLAGSSRDSNGDTGKDNTGEDNTGEPNKWTMLHHMSSSEYLNYESGKFSKTRGVGIFGNDCRDTGIPADCWRFYLYYNRPEKSDYQFTWTEFQQLINRELIGNLANLVNRTLSFLQRFFGGKLQSPEQLQQHPEITQFLSRLREQQSEITEKLEWSRIKEGLHRIMEMADYGNKTFQEKEPWVLVKSADPKDAELAHSWLSALVFLIHDLSICLRPYLPQTAGRIAGFLGLPDEAENFNWQHLGAYSRLNATKAEGQALPKPQILFQQLEDERVAELRQHFSGKQSERTTAAPEPTDSEKQQKQQKQQKPVPASVPGPETWARCVELRVGRIVEVVPHPDATRLFVEKIDCGEAEPRTIVSGLAEHYSPEELLGKTVAVVANLKPAKLRGVKSQGMILAASPHKEEKSQQEQEEQTRQSGMRLVEVLHPQGQPGDRIVVQGFEEAEADRALPHPSSLPSTSSPPSKRISIDDFFAAELFLDGGKAYLQSGSAGLALLVQTSEGAVALGSEQLQSGSIA